MANLPGKIKDAQKDVLLINQNFDDIRVALTDKSGNYTSTGTVSGLVIAAGGFRVIEVNVTDASAMYLINQLPFIPRVDLYIDNDLNGDYYYPAGSSISPALAGLITVEINIARTVFNQVTNEKGTYFCVIRNKDASPHTFYVYLQSFFMPSPELGVATRTQ